MWFDVVRQGPVQFGVGRRGPVWAGAVRCGN